MNIEVAAVVPRTRPSESNSQLLAEGRPTALNVSLAAVAWGRLYHAVRAQHPANRARIAASCATAHDALVFGACRAASPSSSMH